MTLASPNSSHADLLHTSLGCLVSERPALLIHDCHGSTAAKLCECVILAPYLLQLNIHSTVPKARLFYLREGD